MRITVEIRRAVLDDAPALAAILRELGWFASLNAETPEETETRMRRYLTDVSAAPGTDVFVAQGPDGDVVGVTAVNWYPSVQFVCEGYVLQLYLRASARGQGIGRQLLDAVKREAGERHCGRLMLYISHRRDAYQRGFYTKAGWQERRDASLFFLVPDDQGGSSGD